MIIADWNALMRVLITFTRIITASRPVGRHLFQLTLKNLDFHFWALVPHFAFKYKNENGIPDFNSISDKQF